MLDLYLTVSVTALLCSACIHCSLNLKRFLKVLELLSHGQLERFSIAPCDLWGDSSTSPKIQSSNFKPFSITV